MLVDVGILIVASLVVLILGIINIIQIRHEASQILIVLEEDPQEEILMNFNNYKIGDTLTFIDLHWNDSFKVGSKYTISYFQYGHFDIVDENGVRMLFSQEQLSIFFKSKIINNKIPKWM